MDAIKNAVIVLNTFVRKTPTKGVYEKEFYKDSHFVDPDDEGKRGP